jgi:hypothetical protein
VVALSCEICGKSPAEGDVWVLCSDCTDLYRTFIQFVKEHNVDVRDIEPLKQALRLQARQTKLIR